MPAPTLFKLTEQERNEYHRLCRSGKTPVRLEERLSIVLLADEGLTNMEIAELVPMNAHTVSRWRNRFSEGGFDAIEKNRARGATMSGSRSAGHAKLRQQIVKITTTEKPPGETHWSTRTLAAKLGNNAMFVSRVGSHNGLKPHLVKTLRSATIRILRKTGRCGWVVSKPPRQRDGILC